MLQMLQKKGLKKTLARKSVLNALRSLSIPSDAITIHSWAAAHGHNMNLTTVYRVLAVLLEHSIIHRHPSTGNYILCSKPHEPGDHRFLRCQTCNHIQEFIDEALCKTENIIAKKYDFVPTKHLSEIIGICKHCSS
jgi:Fe2+ or Zn2+ uptake regulation protein